MSQNEHAVRLLWWARRRQDNAFTLAESGMPETAKEATADHLAFNAGAAAIDTVKKERAAIEEAKAAFEKVCKYRWFYSDPDFVDRMVDAENECWNETRIPPPGRSVPMDLLAPPDEVRQDNWIAWISAKRAASLDRMTAAMAKLVPEDPTC
jgi:hypothetical protein